MVPQIHVVLTAAATEVVLTDWGGNMLTLHPNNTRPNLVQLLLMILGIGGHTRPLHLLV